MYEWNAALGLILESSGIVVNVVIFITAENGIVLTRVRCFFSPSVFLLKKPPDDKSLRITCDSG